MLFSCLSTLSICFLVLTIIDTMLLVKSAAFDSRINLSPSTECIIEALEICLINNNSTFAGLNLIQTNGIAMGAANSCS